MIKKASKNEARLRKHTRVRKKISGTTERPRLNIFKSYNHIYAQIINDETGTTIAAASTLDEGLKNQIKHGGNIESAKLVGKLIAEKAAAKEIKTVVFDRGGYLYHGRVAALAEAAREAGLNF